MSTAMGRTRCWYCEGTANLAMIRTNTKRLSTLALLGDEAREELAGRLTAPEEEQAEPEQARQGDPYAGPDAGFFDRYVVRLAADEEIDRDEGGKAHDGEDPQGGRNFHYASGSTSHGRCQRRRCRRSLPPRSGTRDALGPRADARDLA
ncbi:hypothetical protein STENM223S_08213 [Streptomyces tendae]